MSREDERRKNRRLAIQDAFSFFLVIPKQQGMSRIYMRDVSTTGLSFFSGEKYTKDQELNIHLYTCPSFYLPISVRVVRAKNDTVAVKYKRVKSVKALSHFLSFLETAIDCAVFPEENV